MIEILLHGYLWIAMGVGAVYVPVCYVITWKTVRDELRVERPATARIEPFVMLAIAPVIVTITMIRTALASPTPRR